MEADKAPVKVAGVVEALERMKVRLPGSNVVLAPMVRLVLASMVPVPVELVVNVGVPAELVRVRLLNVQLVATATLVPKFLLVATFWVKV